MNVVCSTWPHNTTHPILYCHITLLHMGCMFLYWNTWMVGMWRWKLRVGISPCETQTLSPLSFPLRFLFSLVIFFSGFVAVLFLQLVTCTNTLVSVKTSWRHYSILSYLTFIFDQDLQVQIFIMVERKFVSL